MLTWLKNFFPKYITLEDIDFQGILSKIQSAVQSNLPMSQFGMGSELSKTSKLETVRKWLEKVIKVFQENGGSASSPEISFFMKHLEKVVGDEQYFNELRFKINEFSEKQKMEIAEEIKRAEKLYEEMKEIRDNVSLVLNLRAAELVAKLQRQLADLLNSLALINEQIRKNNEQIQAYRTQIKTYEDQIRTYDIQIKANKDQIRVNEEQIKKDESLIQQNSQKVEELLQHIIDDGFFDGLSKIYPTIPSQRLREMFSQCLSDPDVKTDEDVITAFTQAIKTEIGVAEIPREQIAICFTNSIRTTTTSILEVHRDNRIKKETKVKRVEQNIKLKDENRDVGEKQAGVADKLQVAQRGLQALMVQTEGLQAKAQDLLSQVVVVEGELGGVMPIAEHQAELTPQLRQQYEQLEVQSKALASNAIEVVGVTSEIVGEQVRQIQHEQSQAGVLQEEQLGSLDQSKEMLETCEKIGQLAIQQTQSDPLLLQQYEQFAAQNGSVRSNVIEVEVEGLRRSGEQIRRDARDATTDVVRLQGKVEEFIGATREVIEDIGTDQQLQQQHGGAIEEARKSLGEVVSREEAELKVINEQIGQLEKRVAEIEEIVGDKPEDEQEKLLAESDEKVDRIGELKRKYKNVTEQVEQHKAQFSEIKMQPVVISTVSRLDAESHKDIEAQKSLEEVISQEGAELKAINEQIGQLEKRVAEIEKIVEDKPEDEQEKLLAESDEDVDKIGELKRKYKNLTLQLEQHQAQLGEMQKQSAVKVDAKAVVGSMPGLDELESSADELKLQIEQIKKLRGEIGGLEDGLKQGDPSKVVELIKTLGAKKLELAKLNQSVELLSKQRESLSRESKSDQMEVAVVVKEVVGSAPVSELTEQIEQIKKLRGEMAGLENELKQGDPAKVVELIKALGAKKQELAKLNQSVELLKQSGSLSHQDRSQLVGKPEAAKAHELEPVEEKDSESGKLGL